MDTYSFENGEIYDTSKNNVLRRVTIINNNHPGSGMKKLAAWQGEAPPKGPFIQVQFERTAYKGETVVQRPVIKLSHFINRWRPVKVNE